MYMLATEATHMLRDPVRNGFSMIKLKSDY